MAWIDDWRSQTLGELTAHFEAWGALDARAWAHSELEEDIPQSARFLFLRAVWRRMNDALAAAMDDPVTTAMQANGVAADDIAGVIRRCLYTYAFDTVFLIDEPGGTVHYVDPKLDVGPADPRWRLMEVSPQGDLTGREVLGLHESLLEEDFVSAEGEVCALNERRVL